MKKTILCGAAIALASVVSVPASAQQFQAKDQDRLMRGAQYTPPPAQRAQPAPQPQQVTEAQRAAQIAPAAGRQVTYDAFTGPYIGANVGYGIGSASTEADNVGMDGFSAGGFVGFGFTHNMGWLGGYGGVELGYEWNDANGSLGGVGFDRDHNWTATFRPGVVLGQSALGYGIVGYSRARFEAGDGRDWLHGLVLGAGSEFHTASPLKLRVEYTYTNYEDTNIGGIDFDHHENTIKLGALARF